MKKKIGLLLVLVLVFALSCSTVWAAEKTSGFYDIGEKAGVTITPFDANAAVNGRQQDVDGDTVADSYYPGSVRMNVSYTGAVEDGYYGIILVEGTGLPTKDTTVFYINQVTAEDSEVSFNVYPILPEESSVMTLYISSNVEGFDLLTIPVGYAVGVEQSYVPGDVFEDRKVDSKDAIRLAQYLAKWSITLSDSEMLAADVVRDTAINSKDAIKLAQFLAKWNITLD